MTNNDNMSHNIAVDLLWSCRGAHIAAIAEEVREKNKVASFFKAQTLNNINYH